MFKRYRPALEDDLSRLNQASWMLPGEYPELKSGSMLVDTRGGWVKFDDVLAIAVASFEDGWDTARAWCGDDGMESGAEDYADEAEQFVKRFTLGKLLVGDTEEENS